MKKLKKIENIYTKQKVAESMDVEISEWLLGLLFDIYCIYKSSPSNIQICYIRNRKKMNMIDNIWYLLYLFKNVIESKAIKSNRKNEKISSKWIVCIIWLF